MPFDEAPLEVEAEFFRILNIECAIEMIHEKSGIPLEKIDREKVERMIDQSTDKNFVNVAIIYMIGDDFQKQKEGNQPEHAESKELRKQ